MISHLVCEVDYADVLAAQVEYTGVRCREILDDRGGSVPNMQKRPELVASENRDPAGSRGLNSEQVHHQVQANPRENIADAIECPQSENERIRVREILLRSQFGCGI